MPSSVEVVDDLGAVFVGQRRNGLEFHDNFLEADKVGFVGLAKWTAFGAQTRIHRQTLFPARGVESNAEVLGLLEPLEFFTEGGFQTEQQNVVARALCRTPAPAGMIVKFLPGHLGNSLLSS